MSAGRSLKTRSLFSSPPVRMLYGVPLLPFTFSEISSVEHDDGRGGHLRLLEQL